MRIDDGAYLNGNRVADCGAQIVTVESPPSLDTSFSSATVENGKFLELNGAMVVVTGVMNSPKVGPVVVSHNELSLHLFRWARKR